MQQILAAPGFVAYFARSRGKILSMRILKQDHETQSRKGTLPLPLELIVVIAIISILSSIALPNFLRHSGKAKSTEAITQSNAIIKEAAATHQIKGINGLKELSLENSCVALGAPSPTNANNQTTTHLFDYSCNLNAIKGTLKVTATGNSTDSSLENKKITTEVNLTTGVITKVLSETHQDLGGACKHKSHNHQWHTCRHSIEPEWPPQKTLRKHFLTNR